MRGEGRQPEPFDRPLPTTSLTAKPGMTWLVAEFLLLFVALPLSFVLGLIPLDPIPALWVLTAICLVVLLGASGFDRRRLWNSRKLSRRLQRALLPFLIAAPLLALVTLIVAPDKLFGLIRERPLFWGALMVLYPVLSVYPQGVVYRSFIFHRYRRLFRSRTARIVASAVAFSIGHIVFANWIAPTLTLLGGFVFAWTYAHTRSGLVAALQHALFGCFLFTIGLGWYFSSGF